jgi:hypothetical protein
MSDELLLARGEYLYFRNGERVDVTERWTRHKRGDEIITRCERDATAFRSRIVVESRERDGRIAQVEVIWSNDNPNAVSNAQARYRFFELFVEQTRQIESLSTETKRIETNFRFVIAPLMRVYLGDTLRELAAQRQTMVFVPWIIDPTDSDKLLEAHFEKRFARVIGDQEIEVDSNQIQARRYEYLGEQYDASAAFWVDKASGLLSRYEWKEWRVNLLLLNTDS